MSNRFTQEQATRRGAVDTTQPMVLGRVSRGGETMLMVRMPDGTVHYTADMPGVEVGSRVPTTPSELLLAGDESTLSPISISTSGTLDGQDPARALARRIAEEEGVDPDLFERLVQQESSFRPDVVSRAGAIGYAQLMPATAAELGVDPWDPEQNLRGGARYLRQQFDTFGDTRLALAAYNAGPGRVREYGGVPPFPETQDYVRILTGEGDDYRRMQPSPETTGRIGSPPPARPEGLSGPEREARGPLDDLTEALAYLELAEGPGEMPVGSPPPIHRPRRSDTGARALQRMGIASLA